MSSATVLREWRKTPQGRLSLRAQVLANTAAVRWVREHHPDEWRNIVADARKEVGLPVEVTVSGKRYGKKIEHGTLRGERMHRARGEKPCRECLDAKNDWARQHRDAQR